MRSALFVFVALAATCSQAVLQAGVFKFNGSLPIGVPLAGLDAVFFGVKSCFYLY